MDPWRNFRGKLWREKIDLSDFIRHNYQPFTAEPTFLCPHLPGPSAYGKNANN